MASATIHPQAIIEPGAQIGDNTRVWHFAHIRRDAVIGADCVIGKGVFIDQGVRIGSAVKIQNNASVFHGVEIEDGVFIGPHVCFTNDLFPRAVNPDLTPKSAADWTIAKTLVSHGASIGANATIVAGTTIGAWALVAAGSVVTKSVPPYALVRGNPARVVGVVSRTGNIIAQDYRPGIYPTEDDTSQVEIKPEWCHQ
jgi:acetyltransferase-like isoleucine patch superfamily enzyme